MYSVHWGFVLFARVLLVLGLTSPASETLAACRTRRSLWGKVTNAILFSATCTNTFFTNFSVKIIFEYSHFFCEVIFFTLECDDLRVIEFVSDHHLVVHSLCFLPPGSVSTYVQSDPDPQHCRQWELFCCNSTTKVYMKLKKLAGKGKSVNLNWVKF